MDATALENHFGDLLRSDECKDLKMRALYKFLEARSIKTTEGQVRYWIQKYRLPAGAIEIHTVEELQEKYGQEIRTAYAAHTTSHKLMTALNARDPCVRITRQVAENWLRRYGGAGAGLTQILNCGHLPVI